MSDETKPEVSEDKPEAEEAAYTPKEPRRWWLCCAILGRQNILEIVSVDGNDVDGLSGSLRKKYPEFGPDNDIVVDRGICIAQVMGPEGAGQAYVDFRAGLGPMFMAPNNDYSEKENRRPIHFKGRSLMIGPYLWMDFEDQGEQFLRDQIQAIYSSVDVVDKPTVVGADGRPIGGHPGAMGALGQLGR